MNQQKQEAVTVGSQVDLHSLFYTIQGEGPFSGFPAIFIRLAGCNLRCPGCDTAYTEGRKSATVDEVVNTALKHIHSRLTRVLFVVTGGEPFRQSSTTELCNRLARFGTVQVETNGTLAPYEDPERGIFLNKEVHIVCSPKTSRVAPALFTKIKTYKYVLEHGKVSAEDGLPEGVLGKDDMRPARPHPGFNGSIVVTPFDPGGEMISTGMIANMQAVRDSALNFGHIAQLQVHKLINTP